MPTGKLLSPDRPLQQSIHAEVSHHAHAGQPPCQGNSKKLWKPFPSFFPHDCLIPLKYSSCILEIVLEFSVIASVSDTK